jgi:hypothetical protein
MTAATLIAIFIVPVFYVVLQGGVERFQRRPTPAGAAAAAEREA